MRDKATIFFSPARYQEFIQKVKTTETQEQAAEYAMQLATALYAKRDEYGRSIRATMCMTESLLSLKMVTEQYPETQKHFAALYANDTSKQQLIETLQKIVHAPTTDQ